MKTIEATAGVKKYQLTVGWHLNGSYVEGSSTFETVPELLEAYQKAANAEGQTVKRIGVSIDFLNGIPFAARQEAEAAESQLILEAFQKVGYDIFQLAYGRLYLK